jgi:dTMP kinase
LFIVFDGLDGSGKSTQAKLLCRYLRKKGKTFILRAHPSGDNFYGKMSRTCLLMEGNRARISASLFYLLDVVRSVVLYWWRPVDYVVFVRYLMGTAYLPEPFYKLGYLFFLRIVPRSRHMFFIDTSPAEAHSRIESNRSQREMFESLERLEKVHRKITILTSRPEWNVIDGDQPSDAIHRQVRASLAL